MAIGKIVLGLVLTYILFMGLGISEFKTQYGQGKFQNSTLWYKPLGKGMVVGKDSLINMVDLVKGKATQASFFFTVFQMVVFAFALLFVSTLIFGILETSLDMKFTGLYSFGLMIALLLVIGIFSYGFEALFGLNEPVGMVIANATNVIVNGTTRNITNITSGVQPVVSLF